MPSPINPPQPEFHRYRKLVAWTSLVLVGLGTLYLLLSVLVALDRRRNAVLGVRVSTQLTSTEISDCFDDLHDVTVALRKHLENAYHLLGGYDSEEARRWTGEGDIWRRQWRLLGERCRFVERHSGPRNKDLEAMSAAHQELGSIQTTYSRALLRFGNELAPRLDRINKRVEEIGEHLAEYGSPAGASP
ncbi:MAG: hypothetical protein JXP73_14515 [Deltaproteobacteria bacterium]|nr:hypothetical protein [Deltaproteobacteria bacterium]